MENQVQMNAERIELLNKFKQVLVAMGGTTGIAESLRVIKFLEELGHL
jgi:hypothetical protein